MKNQHTVSTSMALDAALGMLLELVGILLVVIGIAGYFNGKPAAFIGIFIGIGAVIGGFGYYKYRTNYNKWRKSLHEKK